MQHGLGPGYLSILQSAVRAPVIGRLLAELKLKVCTTAACAEEPQVYSNNFKTLLTVGGNYMLNSVPYLDPS